MAAPKAPQVFLKDILRSSRESGAFVAGRNGSLRFNRWIEAMGASGIAYPYAIVLGRGCYSRTEQIPCNYPDVCGMSLFDVDKTDLCPLKAHGDEPENTIYKYTFVFLIVASANHHVNVMLYRERLGVPWTIALMDPNYNNENVLSPELTKSLERTWELLRLLLPSLGDRDHQLQVRRGANVNVDSPFREGICLLGSSSLLRAGLLAAKDPEWSRGFRDGKQLADCLFKGVARAHMQQLYAHHYSGLRPARKKAERSATPERLVEFAASLVPRPKLCAVIFVEDVAVWAREDGVLGYRPCRDLTSLFHGLTPTKSSSHRQEDAVACFFALAWSLLLRLREVLHIERYDLTDNRIKSPIGAQLSASIFPDVPPVFSHPAESSRRKTNWLDIRGNSPENEMTTMTAANELSMCAFTVIKPYRLCDLSLQRQWTLTGSALSLYTWDSVADAFEDSSPRVSLRLAVERLRYERREEERAESSHSKRRRTRAFDVAELYSELRGPLDGND